MKILNHIKEVYACGDDKLYNYIIKWFASKFQYPNKKNIRFGPLSYYPFYF